MVPQARLANPEMAVTLAMLARLAITVRMARLVDPDKTLLIVLAHRVV